MRTARHEEALDRQVELILWWKSDVARHFGATFMRHALHLDTDPNDDRRGLILAESQMNALDRAPTYWVSKDMITLVEHASSSMPPQPLRPTDLPTQSGFVYFDRSVMVTDVHGDRVGFRGVLWSPSFIRTPNYPNGVEALNLMYYSDRDEPDDVLSKNDFGEKYRPILPKLIPLHITPWDFNEPWGAEDQRFIDGSVSDVRRFMAAFWTIIQQHIIADYTVPRALRRRTARAKPTPVSEIKVVTLRKVLRRAHDDEEEYDAEQVEWSHRWIVDGHWRNQAVKEGHRLIWISPYVKGPDWLPLVTKDKVYKVSR